MALALSLVLLSPLVRAVRWKLLYHPNHAGLSIPRLAGFARTTWRVYTWAPDEETRRLVLGIGAGLLAHQIFGLTDAFMLGTKPGIVMWILMGLITGLYLRLAPAHLRSEGPEHS